MGKDYLTLALRRGGLRNPDLYTYHPCWQNAVGMARQARLDIGSVTHSQGYHQGRIGWSYVVLKDVVEFPVSIVARASEGLSRNQAYAARGWCSTPLSFHCQYFELTTRSGDHTTSMIDSGRRLRRP